MNGLSLDCRGCGAALVVEAGHKTTQCPYCASPNVLEGATHHGVSPTFALGFSVAKKEAERQVKKYLRVHSFWAPTGVRKATVRELRGVYVPAYLYSATASSKFRASIGEDYTTGHGKNQKRDTEWRDLEGEHRAYVRDVLVTASAGLENKALNEIEPFELRKLRRYSPAVIAGWIAEEPSRSPEECAELARGEATEGITHAIKRFMPGDRFRDLAFNTELEHEALNLTLVPVWIGAMQYREGRPPIRVLCNGQTGKVWGEVPTSWWKVTLTVLVVLAAIALALHWSELLTLTDVRSAASRGTQEW